MSKKIWNAAASAVFLCLFSINLTAQTFTGMGDTIPDDGTPIFFDIAISGLSPSVIDTNFGLEGVCINLTHPYDADLEIVLIAPDSTVIPLSSGNGANGNNYTNTCFTDSSVVSIVGGVAPFNGTYKPEGFLSSANNMQNPNGLWRLYVYDTYPFADQGILLNWSITFGNNPCVPFSFSSSNLPLIYINTNGQQIPDDPKITAHMGIIYNGPGIRNNATDSFNHYNGEIGIEIRGSTSQMFPKKSFGIELRDTAGNEIDSPLLGMPAEHDWILNANFTDKSFMRNVLALQLSDWMGHYAPRYRFCEVVINGEYRGLYILMEKIKRDNDRVDIAKLTAADTTGDDLTGGYIIKIDKATGSGGQGWTSNYSPTGGGQNPTYQYEYPSDGNILPVQAGYIHAFVDSFENAMASATFANPLTGYPNFINDTSFIDFFIINELAKNVDGYRISSFFYKDKNSNSRLLNAGPVWDFDIAFGNADYYNGNIPYNWQYNFNHSGDPYRVPFYWGKLLQATAYKNKLKCRWNAFQNTFLNTTYINTYIDSIALLVDEAQNRNFTIYPILGVYVWPNPSPLPATYTGCVNQVKNWISLRIPWMNNNLPGTCTTTGIDDAGIAKLNSVVYPNPFTKEATLHLNDSYGGQQFSFSVTNITGNEVMQENFSGNDLLFSRNNLAPGIYFYTVKDGEKIIAAGKLAVQ